MKFRNYSITLKNKKTLLKSSVSVAETEQISKHFLEDLECLSTLGR